MSEVENKIDEGYTKYDFDRPDKFSFEHLRSLESIFTVFTRSFATDLSGYLRMPVELEVQKVEQVPFSSDYLEKNERDESVFCISEFDKEQFLIQLEVGFLLRVHAKQLGGDFGKIKNVRKNITEFEKITTEHLLESFLYPNMQEAFRGVQELTFSIYDIETDPQYARITLPQDMVALISMSLRIEEEKTNIFVVIPYLSIEGMIEKLSTDNVLKNREMETPDNQLSSIYDHLLNIKREFIVNLGKRKITLQDLMELEEEDIIILDTIEEGVICSIDNREKFRGKVGTKDGKKAVIIKKALEEDHPESIQKEKVVKIKAYAKNKTEKGGGS